MLILKTILVVDDDGDRGKLEQKPDTEEGRGAMNSKCPTTHLHNLLSNHCSCYMRYTWTKKMGKAEILKTKYNNDDMCPTFTHHHWNSLLSIAPATRGKHTNKGQWDKTRADRDKW